MVAKETHKDEFKDNGHDGKLEVWLVDKYNAKYCVHSKQFGDGMIEPIDIDGLIDKIQFNFYKFIQIPPEEMELMRKNVDIPWHRFSDDSY